MNLDVVVVSYDSAAELPGALGPLPADAHVVVVDNASTDDSVVVAARLGARVVSNPVNAGFGAAANRGVALGTAELVLLLNPDAHVDEVVLRALCARMAARPEVAVMSPRLRRPDGTQQQVWWPIPSAAGAWREALGLHRVWPAETERGFVIGACFLVRRSAFEALGGFDERFWLYSEESDLCRRFWDAGWTVELAEDLEASHVGGVSGRRIPQLVFEHFERGGEHLVAKHGGPAALVSYRLANLEGAAIRALLPGPRRRRLLHTARVDRLLATLVRHPASVRLDSPATGAAGEGRVVCSLEPWDDVWRRNQFIVRELLAAHPNRRFLFVEPPYDWVHELRRRSGRRRHRGLRPLEADGRVVRFEPGKVLPRVLGPHADRSMRRQVRRAADRLGLSTPALWINDPNYAGLATETGWPALYDITDDWTEAGDGDRATERVREAEEILFVECDALVVCSEGLAATRRAARPDLVVIPNAVDADFLRRPRPRPGDLPPGPCAVYVGTLHEDRLDVDLVAELAAARPDLAVVLVGPSSLSSASEQRLAAHPNVHLLGARPYAEVPGYLQHADIVIVPHVVTAFTDSLDPIKAYECLAVGRPTVATPVAGFRGLGEPVRCVDRADFAATVGELVDGGRRSDRPVPVPSWTDRAAVFSVALSQSEPTFRRLRVVYLDHCAKLSGGELALVRMLPALRRTGVDPLVILGEHGPLEERLAEAGADVEVLALDERVGTTHRDEVGLGSLGVQRALAAARDTWALSRHLRELEPDLVHTNSLKAALYGGVAGRLAGVPVVWHIRDRIAGDYLPTPAVVLVRALGHVLPRAIIANSFTTKKTLGRRRRTGVAPSPVVYDAQVATAAYDRVSVPGKFDVALVGRLAPWKGQDVFLRAFALAFAGGPQRAVLAGSAMFGEDDYGRELVELAEELGITEQVEFAGFVDDIGPLLQRVDCVVHASTIPEPFGQVVVEGMAAGLPVIASAAGGPAEVITNDVDGLLCPPGNHRYLAELLRRLADDPAERQRLGQAGSVRALDFTPESVALRVQSTYRSVLGRRD